MERHRLTLDAARHALEDGETAGERVTEEPCAAIEKGKRLNAFLSVFNQAAPQRARDSTGEKPAAVSAASRGMFVAVKDSPCMRGERTFRGSRMS